MHKNYFGVHETFGVQKSVLICMKKILKFETYTRYCGFAGGEQKKKVLGGLMIVLKPTLDILEFQMKSK